MKNWIIAICLSTIFIALIYATAQHILRTDAYDPQVQMAEDLAATLSNHNRAFRGILPRTRVNPEQSLAPFVIVYDNNKKQTFSTFSSDTNLPGLPSGIFDNVKKHGGERLTWQPKKNVRIATVVKKYNNGYVLVGRSLREVENRIRDITVLAACALLASWIVLTIPFLLYPFKRKAKVKAKR